MTRDEFLKLKPSELLRLAIKDARELEKTPDFALDMNHWCTRVTREPANKRVCFVCLAGAVAVKELGVTAEHQRPNGSWKKGATGILWSPVYNVVDMHVRERMHWLDGARSGKVYTWIWGDLTKKQHAAVAKLELTYRIDGNVKLGRLSWKNLLALAADLNRLGL